MSQPRRSGCLGALLLAGTVAAVSGIPNLIAEHERIARGGGGETLSCRVLSTEVRHDELTISLMGSTALSGIRAEFDAGDKHGSKLESVSLARPAMNATVKLPDYHDPAKTIDQINVTAVTAGNVDVNCGMMEVSHVGTPFAFVTS